MKCPKCAAPNAYQPLTRREIECENSICSLFVPTKENKNVITQSEPERSFHVGDIVKLREQHVGKVGWKASYFSVAHKVDAVNGSNFQSRTLGGNIFRPQGEFEIVEK